MRYPLSFQIHTMKEATIHRIFSILASLFILFVPMHYSDSHRLYSRCLHSQSNDEQISCISDKDWDYENINRKLDPESILSRFRPDFRPFETIYREMHQNPELSLQEASTATTVAQYLKSLDLEVFEGIGGHGVVALLRNGAGPTVLLRADMDALPIEEKTGLSYSSKKSMRDMDGVLKPVMHTCGHDMHVASLLATSKLLHAARAEWSGTFIFLVQPNEERNGGAKSMVDDGLYEKYVPVPDIILDQHVTNIRTGAVAIRPGAILTAADSFDVRVFGKGGHAGAPRNCIDPILTASHIIVRLQSIVSREVDPLEVAIITCGKIQAGQAGNMIPDHVDLKLNVRTYSSEVREKVLSSMRRIIHAESDASGVLKSPLIKHIETTPFTINDPEKTRILTEAFVEYFGENLWKMERDTATEDFDNLASPRNIPYVYWNFGGTEAAKWDDANKQGRISEMIPDNHSPFFAPAIQPSMRTAVDAFAIAALTFLD